MCVAVCVQKGSWFLFSPEDEKELMVSAVTQMRAESWTNWKGSVLCGACAKRNNTELCTELWYDRWVRRKCTLDGRTHICIDFWERYPAELFLGIHLGLMKCGNIRIIIFRL